MTMKTTFGFTPAWWTAQDKNAKKTNTPARIVYSAVLVAVVAVAIMR